VTTMPGESQDLRYAVEDMIRCAAKDIILPRFQKLDDSDIATKSGPTDYVTVADTEAEHFLDERLTSLLPGAAVVGEEAAAANPDLIARLTSPGQTWVIDPIDGTGNFVAGRDAFAVVVALVENGETRMGWIHSPCKTTTVWAARGEGTWEKDVRLSVALDEGASLQDMHAALYHRAFKDANAQFGQTEKLGSAAHEYWQLAANRLHVSSFSRLKPWDHAAGVLIHTEAGGYSAMLDGSPYTPGDTDKRGLLNAPSRTIWDTVRALADETRI